ncbi:XrtN system VIT domain-containing protein [Mucilaginibacter celer]|uniref:XrtN system VIT domain-containing protein n=1 Tax=Mucilaginibacter celer TaxID=2305508 RepID=A0A494VRV1_9SPHI|nr:XrtN system VIT domain-containing protein [Mucilaginibacter celer]AYL98337.1 XrtN system VIT domain-containing protein [Mucilaginibacter celer]
MKNILATLSQNNIIKTGLILITISAGFFCIVESGFFEITEGTAFGAFCLNYLASLVFFFLVIFKGFKRLHYWVLLLVLWFVSAFALNRSLNVFDSSVTWLCVVIWLSAIGLILSVFMDDLGVIAKHTVSFLLGIALLLFIYYSVYLTSMYILGIFGAIALGFSLHAFVPAGLAIATFIALKQNLKGNPSLKMAFAAGILIPLVACAVFIWQWKSINKQVNLAINHNTLSEGKLPTWMVIAQNIPHNALAEKIIKADIVYKTANLSDNWFWGNWHSAAFDEPKKHDPFVVIASLFGGEINLDENDRIKILEAMYNSRHQAQERLWTGDMLSTANVITNIKIFPEYRLAYTEKTLTVHNAEKRTWRGNEEAIYTFHVPEGSVVSSLSLWIDGKEQKSRLTTKAKADSAYHEIVGVEQHDPSVLHWQEGNTVTARIFPCTPEENRKFRVGITSPLLKRGDMLTYQSSYFDGPSPDAATEAIQVSFSKKPESLDLPGFDEISSGVYTADRNYRPDEQITFKAPPLANTPFTFAGNGYQLKDYQPQTTVFTPERIYLDLNAEWTASELDELWPAIKNKKVYYYDGKLEKLTDQNRDQVYNRMSKLNFSMFPVNEIRHPETALLITKCAETSPNLYDLNESEFGKVLTTYLPKAKPIQLYNIGTNLTPYLKALKEMRVFIYNEGDLETLQNHLAKNRFNNPQEDSTHVVLAQSGLMIAQTADTLKIGNAPDHLLRLFAYNDIMKKVGPHYFDKTYVQPDVIAEANQAFIASPVSSLIVLETQKDYERFGIDENKNSLQNASAKSSGAVPEPGEWLLILVVIGVINFLVYKNKHVQPEL